MNFPNIFLALLGGSCMMILYILCAAHVYHTEMATNNAFSQTVYPTHLPNHPKRNVTYSSLKCENVLEQMIKGRWVKKLNVTLSQEEEREKLDMDMRKDRRYPMKLTRDDLKCGPQNIIPGNNMGIPAGCDPRSINHCCNLATGKCAGDETSCSCERCTDYRKIIPAEFGDWIPSDSDCKVKFFTQMEACDLISKHVSTMAFLGDSLLRHFYSALLLVLTGDEDRGSLKKTLTEENKQRCSGERQFVNGDANVCHLGVAFKSAEVEDQKICFGARNLTSFFQPYNSISNAKQSLSVVQSLLGRKNSVVVLGVGFHTGFNAAGVIQHYLDPIARLVKERGNGWPYLIWIGPHSSGFLQPVQYINSHGMGRILPYTKAMKEHCQKINIPFFDTIGITTGVHSFDGFHYDRTVNVLKAQILLNHLAETFNY